MPRSGSEPGVRSPASGGIAPVRPGSSLGSWLFDLALPFWSGCPGAEHLDLSGRPAEPGFRRMRVQARQLYVFSEAAIRGFSGAAAIAAGLHRFMSRRGASADGGWARRLRPNGDVLDPTCDLYDIAFVLFGLGSFARLTGDPFPLQQAERTLDFLRRRMAHPAGGFNNTLPAEPGWRQQNPHMHLLEAALALFETTADGRWAGLALELVALFHGRFLEPDGRMLGEYFSQDWRLAAGIDGDKVEPGHHAEWIWLLDRHQALVGPADAAATTDAAIRQLERVCRQHGTGPETGLVRDEIGRDGSLRLGSARLWPQTEMLKAECVLQRRGGDGTGAIARIAGNLLGRYLVGAEGHLLPPGTWIDRLDAFARPAIDRVPTSSFYHIMSAWTELDRLEAARPG